MIIYGYLIISESGLNVRIFNDYVSLELAFEADIVLVALC